MKSTLVDPWGRDSEENEVEEITKDPSLCFEDSFVADCADTDIPTSRLPDSAEYLASLESKLERLKCKRKGKDILKSLEERNKSSMMNFLSNENQNVLDDDDFILDTPVGNSHPIMRYVAPDRQALTVGELVELLKADHLAQVLEQHDSDEEKKSQEIEDA